MLLHLRDAAPADADALAELHARSRAVYYRAGGHEVAASPSQENRDTWHNLVDDPRMTVLAAVAANNVVGVLALDAEGVFPSRAPDEKRVRLVGIFVEPGHWSIGVGSTLMDRFVEITRRSDAVGEVEVWERNARALRFYEHHGWTRDGTSRPGPADTPYVGFVHLP
jgi:GNAT superfamily N-acetyltransferase